MDQIYKSEENRININPIQEGIDETLFDGGNNIEEIVFKCEKVKLLGKRCRILKILKYSDVFL